VAVRHVVAANLHRRLDGPALTTAAAPSVPFLRWSWESYDAHRAMTLIAFLGVAAAGVMAFVGLPPIDVHGPLHYLGVMDPLCGATRAAFHTMRGEWVQAWRYNPLGILAVAGAVAATGRAVVGILTRRWVTVAIAWTPRRRRWVVWLILALAVVLEVRQQLLVTLLTGG
jgi:hypothetical protein